MLYLWYTCVTDCTVGIFQNDTL